MPLFLALLVLAAIVVIYLTTHGRAAPPESRSHVEVDSLPTLQEAMQAQVNADQPRVCAMVLLDDADSLSIDSLRAHIVKRWPGYKPLGEVRRAGTERYFEMGIAEVSYAIIQPIPGTYIEEACRHDEHPSRTHDDWRSHCAAVLVGVTASEVPLQDYLVLSHAITALVRTCDDAIGAFFTISGHIMTREEILDHFDLKNGSLAVGKWISCKCYRDEDGRVVGYTRGLRAFGKSEFEAVDAAESPRSLKERLEGIAVYSLTQCDTILNGDTIGEDEYERIRVLKRPSETIHKGYVFQLQYEKPSPGKGWD